MSFRLFAAASAVLLLAGPTAAQLDPEPKTPYLWRVVLKTQPHPLLSPAFREQLKRDIAAALQPGLGPLGTVDVIDLAGLPRDRWDPLWQQFEDKGFAALDAPRDLTGTKTHFLSIDHADGQYRLEARQHDGFSGLASPVVRRQAVRAPELVGRTAGLMLDRDFGLAGTAEAVFGKNDEAKVTVRGGQLGPVEKLVKVGDVFAVSQVQKTDRPAPPPARTATGKVIAPPPGTAPPPGLTPVPRPFTLLRVTEVEPNGVLKCAVFSQFEAPLAPPKGGRAVGYRCLKLGTVEAPLTVRLASSDGTVQKSPGGVLVRATEEGFRTPPNARDTLEFKDKEGAYRSGRPLANVACVTVSMGPGQGKFFAVPVLGPDPVTLPFETNPRVEERVAFERAALAEAARVSDARNAQSICFDATARLIDKQKNAEALARARGGLQAADATDTSVSDAVARLKEQAGASPSGPKLLEAIEKQLVALRQHNAELAAHIKTLEAVVLRENDPATAAREVQAQALAARIDLLVARGDVDEALNAYGQFLTLMPDNADAKARRDKLKTAWTPKNDAHAKAREYLLRTWPAVATVPDFRDSLKRVEDEVKVLTDNGDRLALRKLLAVFNAAAVKLNDLAALLDPTSAGDQKLLEDAKKAGEVLAGLEVKITEFVKKE